MRTCVERVLPSVFRTFSDTCRNQHYFTFWLVFPTHLSQKHRKNNLKHEINVKLQQPQLGSGGGGRPLGVHTRTCSVESVTFWFHSLGVSPRFFSVRPLLQVSRFFNVYAANSKTAPYVEHDTIKASVCHPKTCVEPSVCLANLCKRRPWRPPHTRGFSVQTSHI